MATGDKRVIKAPGKSNPTIQTSFGMLNNMSEMEAHEYMTSLAKQELKLEGLEYQINLDLKKAFANKVEVAQEISSVQGRLNDLKKQAERLQGKIEAFTSLLVFSEDNRRSEKKGEDNGK